MLQKKFKASFAFLQMIHEDDALPHTFLTCVNMSHLHCIAFVKKCYKLIHFFHQVNVTNKNGPSKWSLLYFECRKSEVNCKTRHLKFTTTSNLRTKSVFRKTTKIEVVKNTGGGRIDSKKEEYIFLHAFGRRNQHYS
jgi:hypothetical protein